MVFLNVLNSSVAGWMLGLFGLVIVVFLVIDLGLLNRKAHRVSFRSALLQTIFWVSISLGFGVLVYHFYDPNAVFDYYNAYQTEYALSVDNIFVIILILRHFRVEEKYYHTILFWGILGAVVFRGIFIFLGAALVNQYHWILYVFGFFLLFSGFKLMLSKDDGEDINIDKNWAVRFARRFLNFTTDDHKGKFFVRKNGMLYFTQLFMVLILIESTDLIFAVDSIPAVFAISQDEFILYTSNIFAVMGLRAMFFLLADILDRFYLLKRGLSLVLIFIGLKMLVEMFHHYEYFHQFTFVQNLEISSLVSLIIILTILVGSIVLSLLFPKKTKTNHLATENQGDKMESGSIIEKVDSPANP
jgi:tellurite resistance protein TerC